jgi:hypothetical protein
VLKERGEKGETVSAATRAELKALRDRMNEVAAKLRNGALDQDTVEMARDTVDGLTGFGRAFTDSDKTRIRDLSKRADANASEDNKKHSYEPPPEELEKGPKGRVRRDLAGNQGPGSGKVKSAGEMKEDQLSRLIESGRKKVVPQYRKPLEDYYRAVSE